MREDLIRVKLKEIEEGLKEVEENLPSSYARFRGLGLVKDGIYKKIEFCIENVLDICAVLNADLGLGIPADEDDILDNLVEGKVMSPKAGSLIGKMKGFRNFLVHRYGKLDDRRAFETIRGGFMDFREIRAEVNRILAKKR